MKKWHLALLGLFVAVAGYAFTNDWDETDPVNHTQNKNWPAEIRQVKVMVGDRLASWISGFATGETAIGAFFIPLIEQSSKPTAAANYGYLYTKDVAASTELFYEDAAGNELQLSGIVGEVKMFSGTAATKPTGWMVCDGSAISRTTYSGLFSVIGTRFGTGDGSTTFNIPNLVEKFPRGIADNAATGAGSDTHSHSPGTLTMPAHSHSSGTLGFAIGALTLGTGGTGTGTLGNPVVKSGGKLYSLESGGTGYDEANITTGTSSTGSGSGSTGNSAGTETITGGTTANGSTLPAYTSLIYIIKY